MVTIIVLTLFCPVTVSGLLVSFKISCSLLWSYVHSEAVLACSVVVYFVFFIVL
jgi:hypothetical protein